MSKLVFAVKRTSKDRLYKIAICFLVMVAVSLMVFITTSGVYASQEYWAVKAGGKTVAYVNSRDAAEETIEKIKSSYVTDGAEDVTVSISPEITYEQKYFASKDVKPVTWDADLAAKHILTATKNGKRIINVTTVQVLKKTGKMKYGTVVQKTSKLMLNTTKLARKGVHGTKTVSSKITTVNGRTVESKVLGTEVIKRPVDRVVYQGTKVQQVAVGTKSSKTSSIKGIALGGGDGDAVAKYALQFVGNPYVYGGTSLTNGCDCSGFVMSVYKHFGVSLPHDAGAHRSYGTAVPSLSQAKPGDLVGYYGHIAIYIGNGKIVHAQDESHGIVITNTTYSGKPILAIRRIFK